MNAYASSLKQKLTSYFTRFPLGLFGSSCRVAKRRESVTQEIFARMIIYNFTEMMTSHVVISQKAKQHQYQVNFTVAVQVCRHFLRSRDDEPPPDVEAQIRKYVLPIRSIRLGQQNTRKIRYKSAVSFVYRVA